MKNESSRGRRLEGREGEVCSCWGENRGGTVRSCAFPTGGKGKTGGELYDQVLFPLEVKVSTRMEAAR